MVGIQLTLDMDLDDGCLDTGCSVTLIDRAFLALAMPNLPIKTMASLIKVRRLGSNVHETAEYMITPLYLPGEESTTILAPREIHIVDNLKANVLIGIDIMVPKQIDIIASQSKANVGSYSISIPVEMRAKAGRAITHLVYAKKSFIVPPHSQIQIPVYYTSLLDRDFIFKPDNISTNLTLYAHFVDSLISTILVKNNTDYAVQIPRNFRVGTVQESDIENYYHITTG